MISPLIIQNILETARIEEVVGDFVHLKKRGVNLQGLCPFHNEKTPSFNVSPAKGIFKCFGCGKAGNSLKFVMEHEHFSYPEAIRYLAKKYSIEIEETELSPEEKQVLDARESLLALNQFAANYFANNLFETDEGKSIGLSYFKERGFTTDTLKKFNLGYSSEKWDGLLKAALQAGYKMEFLEKTGLVTTKEDKHYDRFRARVIFPIQSLSGRIIGFGGRVLISDPQKAKYLNSPESEIYHKGSTLYGIYQARNAIITKDECYLVEGYTDVISLHQAGFQNVVASSGTALTLDQIKLIKRFTANITILYDGDAAGIKASFRGIDMFLEQGMNVKIVLFPDKEDPDSFVRKNRHDDVTAFLEKSANNFILFKTGILLKEAQNDPIKRATMIREIVNSIGLIPDAISRNVYVKECSNILNITEQSLMNELNKILRKKFAKINEEEGGQQVQDLPDIQPVRDRALTFDQNDTEFQERELIRLLFVHANEEMVTDARDEYGEVIRVKVAGFIVHDILVDEIPFSNPVYQEIFNEFALKLELGDFPDEQFFIQHPKESYAIAAVDLISSPYSLSKNWAEKKNISVPTEKEILAEMVTSSVLSFKLKKIEKMIFDFSHTLKTTVEEEEIQMILVKQRALGYARQAVTARLGRIVTS
jgi:DNA primase